MATPFIASDTTKQTKLRPTYVVSQEIGDGSSCTVYKGKDQYNQDVAIKRVDIPGGSCTGITPLIEIDILSRLTHPNIIRSRDIVCQRIGELRYYDIVLPLCDGTLAKFVPSLSWLCQIGAAIEYLHEQGILHLDVKLCNVLVKDGKPYLADFGISMPVDDVSKGFTSDKEYVSLDYRAVEHLRAKGPFTYTEKTDVWSFGIIILTCWLGRYLFDLEAISQDMDSVGSYVASRVSPLPSDVQPRLIPLLTGMLDLNPVSRWTMKQVMNELRSLAIIHDQAPIYNVSLPHPNLVLRPLAVHILDYIHYMQVAYVTLYPQAKLKAVFLAVDLLYRVSSLISDTNAWGDNVAVQMACMWVANTLVSDDAYCGHKLLESMYLIYGKDHFITIEKLAGAEMRVIGLLRGRLYANPVYDRCESLGQVMRAWVGLVLEPNRYAMLDMARWSDEAADMDGLDKAVTVQEFFRCLA